MTAPGAVRMAFSELGRTFRELTRYRVLVVYLAAYLLFNDGIQTVLAVAGAFGADTLGISLQFNMATILIIQLIAAPGAVVFGRLAGPTRTRTTLMAALAGWCVAIAFGVGLAPLEPRDHGDFDYRLQYGVAGSYEVSAAPELSDSPGDRDWRERHGELESGDEVSRSEAAGLAAHVADVEGSRFSISIRGGPLDGVRETGLHHPSNLTRGPIDWWPRALRQAAWDPLGISADYQWLILGSVVGIVLGGSQALARSLFAYMTPESRSAEFFGFFGFVSRASAVFGPMVYLLFTGLYDTRVAILLVLVLILAGTIVLGRVDVAAGGAVAAAEDVHRKPAAPSGGEISE